MSDEAFARALNRETRIWPLFSYSAPFPASQVAQRIIVFALYANAYKNSHGYLNEIEDSELSNLLSDYNAKISELTTAEQVLVNEIVAKRYLSSIDQIIHTDKMATFQEKIDNESAEMDAKFEALETDQAALLTMIERVSAETEKTEARIKVLQAEAQIEDINLSLADIEVSEKEIRLAETNLRILQAGIEILRIQLRVVEAGLELTEVDLRKAELEEKSARIQIETLRAGFTEGELEIAQLQTDLEDNRTELMDKEGEIATARKDDLENTVKPFYEQYGEDITENVAKKAEMETEKYSATLVKLDNELDTHLRNNAYKVALSGVDKNQLTADNAIRDASVENNETVNSGQKSAAETARDAAITAANTLATANVISTLTHTIGGE